MKTCSKCGEKKSPDQFTARRRDCKACIAARCRARRAAMTPAARFEMDRQSREKSASKGYRKSYYEKRKSLGLCHCGQPAREGLVRCAPCAAKYRATAVARVASGLCDGCSAPRGTDGTETKCRQCAAAHRQRNVRRHGIEWAEYEVILAEQGGGCAVCGTDVPGGMGRFHIDHDHSCCPGKWSCGECVRGLTCAACNAALGGVSDSVERLQQLVAYLLS